jgi:hypothetical protein
VQRRDEGREAALQAHPRRREPVADLGGIVGG